MDDPILRVAREIHAALEGRYDREVVREYLRKIFRQQIKVRYAESGRVRKRAEINAGAERGAAEVEKVIWEGLDSALGMGIKALMIAAATVYLPAVGRQTGEAESKVREQMDAKDAVSDEIVKIALNPWLEQFATLFSHAGRPPKGEDRREREANEREIELETLRAIIDEIIAEWTEKKNAPNMTAAILRKELGKRKRELSARTLTRRLGELGESMDSIKDRIKKSRAT